MPRTQEPEIRDLVAPAVCNRLDVINVQADGFIATLSIRSHKCAAPQVACEHRVARAHGYGVAAGGFTLARRRRLFTPRMSLFGA